MSSRPVLLSCEAVSKQFGARPLFQDLSFALFEGDRVALVDPAGCNKFICGFGDELFQPLRTIFCRLL